MWSTPTEYVEITLTEGETRLKKSASSLSKWGDQDCVCAICGGEEFFTCKGCSIPFAPYLVITVNPRLYWLDEMRCHYQNRLFHELCFLNKIRSFGRIYYPSVVEIAYLLFGNKS
jgi:hypothetical protein